VDVGMKSNTPAYAVLRYDSFHDTSTPIENLVTVMRVLLDEATARAEVERLNALNGEKGCKYFVQITRIGAE
jgi:hypothetical protein